MASAYVRGARLECRECGDGEPLLLVHGSASDERTWQAQRDEFGRRFRVLSYSRRYHWPNEPIAEGADYSMTEQVDDLEALLDLHLGGSAHLVGHSYGAFLCLLLAVRRPDLARTLVLAEPPAITLFVSSTPRPQELLRLVASRPRTAAAIVKFGATGVAPASKAFRNGDSRAGVRIFGDAVFGKGGYARMSEAQREQIRDNLPNIKAELLGSGFAPLDPADVRRVRAPALLVDGEHSIALFGRVADRLEELLPRCERVEIAGARHAMHIDNPVAFNAAVLSFLPRAA